MAVTKGQLSGISPIYYHHDPWLLSKETNRKQPKELLPLIIAYIWQLEILLTALLFSHLRFPYQVYIILLLHKK